MGQLLSLLQLSLVFLDACIEILGLVLHAGKRGLVLSDV